MEGWMEGCMGGEWMDGWKDRGMKDEGMKERMKEWKNERMKE